MSDRKAVTIADVAREAEVSRAAVSKVIRDAYGVSAQMRQRVNAAIERLNYRPSFAARAIRGSGFALGFELHELNNPAPTRILRGAAEAVEGSGYQLVVTPVAVPRDNGHHAIETLMDLGVDGIVAVSPLVDSSRLEDVARRIPLVIVSRHENSPAYDTVTGNDIEGTRLAMHHLLSLGHRRITHLTGNADITAPDRGTPRSVRLTTYRNLMAESGNSEHIAVARVETSQQAAYERTLELLNSRQPPTAIFAANDELAMGSLRAVAERGLTAADVSVIGYDDVPMAGHPLVSLSTVDQLGDQLGAIATRLLIERLKGRTEARHEWTTPQLRIRNSTSKPR